MKDIANVDVENEIVKVVSSICKTLMIEMPIDINTCPGNIPGITSQILVTVMGKLQTFLCVTIPDNVYIFHDKKNNKQLSVKEAANKLIKTAKHG